MVHSVGRKQSSGSFASSPEIVFIREKLNHVKFERMLEFGQNLGVTNFHLVIYSFDFFLKSTFFLISVKSRCILALPAWKETHKLPCSGLSTRFICWDRCQSWTGTDKHIREFFSHQEDQIEISRGTTFLMGNELNQHFLKPLHWPQIDCKTEIFALELIAWNPFCTACCVYVSRELNCVMALLFSHTSRTDFSLWHIWQNQ